MELREMRPGEAELAVRALKTIATNDGQERLSDYHRAAIAAFQAHIARSALDVDTLPTIAATELAAAIPDEETRVIAVHDLAFMALADPDALGEDRLKLVRIFAKALGVAPDILDATAHAVRRQTVRLQLDAMRMMLPSDGASWTERMRKAWEAVAPFLGVTDAALAAKYRALGDARPGTLGRAYFDFITSRGLAFPGEKKGAPESYFVAHDLTHILTGYGTDRDGEVSIIGYQAGYGRTKNPLSVILLALVQVQLGMVLDPVAPALTGELSFDLLFRGLRRGSHATIDFTGGGWDFGADFDQPVDALREKYGVLAV